MYDFTRKRFQNLPHKKQHKKCAELLRFIYEKALKPEEWLADWCVYQELRQWMHLLPTHDQPTLKTVADHYHEHQQQAEISKKEHSLLPRIRTGDRQIAEEVWPIAVYLDHVRSAHNVGSIIRTMEAFSLGSLYFSAQTPFISQKQVQDTAMGAIQWVNCQQEIQVSALPHPLIVLETSSDAISLYDFHFPTIFTLVLGNEEYGCSDEILKIADHVVEIPLRGHKNSLNVANAFAIAAGEISRQKHMNMKGIYER